LQFPKTLHISLQNSSEEMYSLKRHQWNFHRKSWRFWVVL